MKLLLAVIGRWWDNRFHPMAHIGFDRLVLGLREGRSQEMAIGLGMLVVGMNRQRPRRRLYAREIVAGDSVRIRVVERGQVVSDVEIPAVEA